MLPFDLAQQFQRAQRSLPFPRGAASLRCSVTAAAGNRQLSVFAAIGVVCLGGMMMMANLAQERKAAQALVKLESNLSANASEPPKVATATPPSKASEVPSPTPIPAAKTATRIDLISTGSIKAEPPAKLRPKSHKMKLKVRPSKE